MLVNENDQYVGKSLMVYGEFSRGEIEFFRTVLQPGMVVADVGANIGALTVPFAKMVGQQGAVIAYEPQRLIYQMLCANVALNNLNNVVCNNLAVGAEPAVLNIGSPDPDQANNFGGISLEQLKGGHETVGVVQLTSPCHFLKIDVEGMELEVLKGATDMIKSFEPLMYIENDRAEKSDALVAYIRELGYTPRWHTAPLFEPNNFRGVKENIWGRSIFSFNMICVPRGVEGFDVFDEVKGNHLDYIKERSDGKVPA